MATLRATTCAAFLAAGAFVGAINSASAATFTSCVGSNYNISTKVSSASACAISDNFTNDSVGSNAPLTVNAGAFFGFTDWNFDGKIGTGNLTTNGDAGGATGMFNLTKAALAGPEVMLVFKSGQGTTLVGYLINSLSGSWSTMFTEPPFSFPGRTLQRDVSHISVYSRGSFDADVPLPATGLSLLAALAGLAMARKRLAA